MVVQFGTLVVVVTEPEVGTVVAIVPWVWVVAVIGPWVGLVTEPWVELVIELQVVVLFGSAVSVVVLILS